MLPQEQYKDILARAMRLGADFAEIYAERTAGRTVFCEEDKIERITSGIDQGAGLRLVRGNETFYAYTNEVTFDGLQVLLKTVQGRFQGGGKVVPAGLIMTPGCHLPVREMPDQIPIERKIEVVTRANQAARACGSLRQLTVLYRDTLQKVWIANSRGVYAQDERVRLVLVVMAVAEQGMVVQTGYEPAGGSAGFELLEGDVVETTARKAAQRALAMLQAKPAPAGRMPVILAAEAGGTMIHEAVGHGLEADLVQKQASQYAGRLGTQIASPLITVMDDATLPGRNGSYCFDDEGAPGQATVLIEKGILKNYLSDGLRADKDGKPSTGNGRRQSYHFQPIPRMSNTYIASGTDDPGSIVQSIKKGLLATRMGGGQVNTVNGDFVFEVSEGYLIENGEPTTPVRGASLIGNGLEVLMSIDRVGRDLGFGMGTCGKDGQGVPVGDAQPTIRIPELTVGGTV